VAVEYARFAHFPLDHDLRCGTFRIVVPRERAGCRTHGIFNSVEVWRVNDLEHRQPPHGPFGCGRSGSLIAVGSSVAGQLRIVCDRTAPSHTAGQLSDADPIMSRNACRNPRRLSAAFSSVRRPILSKTTRIVVTCAESHPGSTA